MNHQYISNLQQYLNGSETKTTVKQKQINVSSRKLSTLHSFLQHLRIKHYIKDLTKSTFVSNS